MHVTITSTYISKRIASANSAKNITNSPNMDICGVKEHVAAVPNDINKIANIVGRLGFSNLATTEVNNIITG